jgi:S1-C subfamily serine protease
MHKQLLGLGALLVALSVLLARQQQFQGRIAELEARQSAHPAEVDSLRAELAVLRQRSATALDELRAIATAGATRDELEARVAALQVELDRAGSELAAQERRGAALATSLPGAIGSALAPILDRVENQGRRLDHLAIRDEEREAATSAELARLEGRIPREVGGDDLWNDLLGPTVQVSGEETVGSGVLLRSRADADGAWRTPILTAWHVIRDLRPDADTGEVLVPVTLYARDGAIDPQTALLLEHDADLDVALLELRTSAALPHGAKLASRETLRRTEVFEPVWAVGCPLGNDPIPTAGTLSDTHHHVDGMRYWMISAPTYIGNSGGGVYHGRTRELVGVFTKIYTHGSARPTVVPHMGLATPLETVYDWLEHEGFAGIEPDEPRTETAAARR